MRERSVVRLSVTPSTKCSCSGPPPILANGKTTIERRGGTDFQALRVGADFARAGWPTFERIDPDRFGDVLELDQAKVADREIETPFDLPIGVLGEADRARLGNSFEPRGDIDAIAHQVAVTLLDDIAEMDADAELDAAICRQAGVALDHAVLHFDRAAHRVDHAAELDEDAVAGALDDAAVVGRDGRVDESLRSALQPRQRAILVRAGEPAIADDIGDQDRREFPGLARPLTHQVDRDATRCIVP